MSNQPGAVQYEHGVNTAADVTAEKIRVISGFGDALTTQLVAWRQKLERDFHFARFQQPVADVESLLARVTQSCSNALDQFHAEAVSLSRERDQSRADLQSLANKIREQGTDWNGTKTGPLSHRRGSGFCG